jgi:hypothetical protein
MRTTLDIADDVLLAVKEAARRQKTSVGAVISELARRSLTASPNSALATDPARGGTASALQTLGIHPRPSRGGLVTNELINRLRDDDIY